jgi:hypothetical protein
MADLSGTHWLVGFVDNQSAVCDKASRLSVPQRRNGRLSGFIKAKKGTAAIG